MPNYDENLRVALFNDNLIEIQEALDGGGNIDHSCPPMGIDNLMGLVMGGGGSDDWRGVSGMGEPLWAEYLDLKKDSQGDDDIEIEEFPIVPKSKEEIFSDQRAIWSLILPKIETTMQPVIQGGVLGDRAIGLDNIEVAALIIIRTIYQADQDKAVYVFNMDNLIGDYGDGVDPYHLDRQVRLGSILDIHEQVRDVLHAPKTPFEKMVSSPLHAEHKAFWLNPLDPPDLASVAQPSLEFVAAKKRAAGAATELMETGLGDAMIKIGFKLAGYPTHMSIPGKSTAQREVFRMAAEDLGDANAEQIKIVKGGDHRKPAKGPKLK